MTILENHAKLKGFQKLSSVHFRGHDFSFEILDLQFPAPDALAGRLREPFQFPMEWVDLPERSSCLELRQFHSTELVSVAIFTLN